MRNYMTVEVEERYSLENGMLEHRIPSVAYAVSCAVLLGGKAARLTVRTKKLISHAVSTDE